jgi:hypothetical protein
MAHSRFDALISLTIGGFFSSPNLKKKIFQKAILSFKLKFPSNNSKQQIYTSSSG